MRGYGKRIQRFEELLWVDYLFCEQRRSVGYLRHLIRRVWKTEGRRRKRPPLLFVHAPKRDGYLLSYCHGRSHIYLHSLSMNISTLLHELTHALGYGDHTSGFVRRYILLLGKYGRCNVNKLTNRAKELRLL